MKSLDKWGLGKERLQAKGVWALGIFWLQVMKPHI